MKTSTSMLVALMSSAALLAGCASSGSSPYYADTYGNPPAAVSSGYGVIESIQVVQNDGRTSGAGAIVGGLVGALAGSQIGSGSGRTAATVAGGVAGAAVGNKVESNRNAGGQEMYQINIRMNNGEIRSVVQDSAYDLRVGNRVRIVDGRAYRY